MFTKAVRYTTIMTENLYPARTAHTRRPKNTVKSPSQLNLSFSILINLLHCSYIKYLSPSLFLLRIRPNLRFSLTACNVYAFTHRTHPRARLAPADILQNLSRFATPSPSSKQLNPLFYVYIYIFYANTRNIKQCIIHQHNNNCVLRVGGGGGGEKTSAHTNRKHCKQSSSLFTLLNTLNVIYVYTTARARIHTDRHMFISITQTRACEQNSPRNRKKTRTRYYTTTTTRLRATYRRRFIRRSI